MDWLALLLVAVGLAMDAFAVSISSGACLAHPPLKQVLKMAFFFGFFQGFMPLLGWLGGISFKKYMETVDHWVVLLILAGIGIKMIIEGSKPDHKKEPRDPFALKILLLLAIATSIDAFAVGISLALLEVNIVFAASVIAGITFLISALGIYLGCFFSSYLGKKMEIIGGLILIAIGIRIFYIHMFA
jgi:putative Mn2+ efflux pump MntP